VSRVWPSEEAKGGAAGAGGAGPGGAGESGRPRGGEDGAPGERILDGGDDAEAAATAGAGQHIEVKTRRINAAQVQARVMDGMVAACSTSGSGAAGVVARLEPDAGAREGDGGSAGLTAFSSME
jgi:hypothetical protein